MITQSEKEKVSKYLKESLEEEFNKSTDELDIIKIDVLTDGSINVTTHFRFCDKEEYEQCFHISYESFCKIIKLYNI